MPKSNGRGRAAVVGAGFGGLAAAIRLQAGGFETVLFEARDQPGGRAYVYRDSGFTFDGGPTVITAPSCIEELFTLAERKMSEHLELLPVEPFYRLLFHDGERFDYTNDTQHLLSQIRRFNPRDAKGYVQFLDYSRRVFEVGYQELVATPFLRFWDMVRQTPKLAMLRADRSVYQAVSRFIEDERLRQALSFHSLLIGGNPFEASAIYTLIHFLERAFGVFFPKGGTGALVHALTRLFIELGGELRLSSPIKQISLEGHRSRAKHRVVPEEGAPQLFDLVVSNADLHHTYATLYHGVPSAEATRKRLEQRDWTMSLVVIYFGTNRKYDDLVHHTILFGPRYKELLQEIFEGPRVPDDFSLYLHAPTVTDPSLAPPGCSSFYVLSPVPHLGNAPVNWEGVQERYADCILASLEKYLPNLRRHIVTQRMITPLHFETELRSYQGSAFSVSPTLTQSAYFRPHNKDPRIPGLYLVGAGTHPGAGVPGVINSAKATASIIFKDFPKT